MAQLTPQLPATVTQDPGICEDLPSRPQECAPLAATGIGGEAINDALKRHATAVQNWTWAELADWLHLWAGRFNAEFKLNIDTPALRIDREHWRKLGCYRADRNGLGLRHEVTLNTRYLSRPQAKLLETLLHELLHEWQELHGSPCKRNHHNREFRQKAESLGLMVSKGGCSLGVAEGPFRELLRRFGVDDTPLLFPGDEQPLTLLQGISKMRKWSCGCTNVRAAVELRAKCLLCGNTFALARPAW